MSEPMTSGEIEDVLSSIRKLVSEDLRPQVRPAAPVVPREVGPRESDKLILTPALRVVEGSAEAEATLAAMPEAAPEPRTRLRLEAVVSTFAANVSPPAEGWEPETGDASVTRLVRTPVVPLSEPEAARVAEAFPDAAAADDSGDVEDAVLTGSLARLHFAWQAQPDEADAAAEDGDDVLAGEGDDAFAGADEAPEAPMLDIDSDALADLVRDILRDELQGAMGERMTRNIRKLVRAEVARILATRDLA